MKMKKLAQLMLCGATALSMAACSSSAPKTTETESTSDKVTVWAWDETFNIKAVEEAKAVYAKENPDVEIEVVTMSQDDIVQKLNTSLSSGKVDGLPNIVLIEDYRIPGYLQSYPDAFEDLTSIVNEEDFMSYKFAVNKIDDKIYGVPFDSGVTGLFYRTDYFEEAGFTAEDMKNITWSEYIEMGKKVKEVTGHDMLTMDPSDLGLIRMMLQSADSWYLAEDGKTVTLADNEVLKKAMETYKDIFNSGFTKQVADWDSFVSAFQNGDVATVPSGCWIASSITKAEDLSGKWAIAEFPRLDDVKDSKNASSIGGGGWYVIKGVPGNEQAIEFLSKTFASNDELMDQLAKDISLVSTLKSAANTETYKEGVPFFSDEPIFENFSKWASEVQPVNYGLHTYTIEDILTEAGQAYVQGGDLDKALDQAQQQAEGAVAY
ncbi:extracellular solute-binding protein [uncultured Dubosiella sp.]|uniref:ABC transporter substrate-binding protein n=2 Tax=uncultured Dubosiella sp. TaxID=1937011 RepID=UPI00259B9698|nr:extracellular solute-binding protein [uncultured Dubosiella sp.]